MVTLGLEASVPVWPQGPRWWDSTKADEILLQFNHNKEIDSNNDQV